MRRNQMLERRISNFLITQLDKPLVRLGRSLFKRDSKSER